MKLGRLRWKKNERGGGGMEKMEVRGLGGEGVWVVKEVKRKWILKYSKWWCTSCCSIMYIMSYAPLLCFPHFL